MDSLKLSHLRMNLPKTGFKMERILTLLDLHKQASQSPDLKSFKFTALNHTNRLVSYKQAVFWETFDISVKLDSVSGNSTLDANGSYAQWLKGFIKKPALVNAKSNTAQNVFVFCKDTIDDHQKKDWSEYTAEHCALLAIRTPEGDVIGGLWLERNEPFDEKDIALLEELCILYSQTYAFLKLREKSNLISFWKTFKKHQKWMLLLCLLIAFMPVRLTVTAPAEIVAKNPTVMTVPYDGVLDKVTITPGKEVETGQTLFTMDTTDLDGQIEAAKQALGSANKNLSRIRRESLSIPEKKTEITQLMAEIAARKIDYTNAQKRMKKSTILAPQNGIAIFSDASDYEGQPVRTGQKIMIISDPEDIELLIKVPVDNMVPVAKNSMANFFLNVAPLNGYDAHIHSIGYQPGIDSDGLLTYKLRAKISQTDTLRIGWKGTAKIKGEWTVLLYSVLRRPLITLRHLTGI
jgi:hypothetical protein